MGSTENLADLHERLNRLDGSGHAQVPAAHADKSQKHGGAAMILEHGMGKIAWSWSQTGTVRAGFGTSASRTAERGVAALSDVRSRRIAVLQQKIQAGTYRVSTAELADVLLRRMLTSCNLEFH
jgi:hypothetical protein